MIKKLSAAVVMIAVFICFASCGFDSSRAENKQDNVQATAKSTAVYNHFKDRIPEFKFDNTPIEKYEDGLGYSLSVKCSEKEYKNYLKKLKKTGFKTNSVEADTYYSASDEKGYFVEVTYINEMLSVYIGIA